MKMMKICVLLAALLATFALRGGYESEEPVDFTLPQLHGDPVSLAELRPKWVVLNYWATWCVPCRKEIPDLSELHSRRDDIVVLGLAFEEADVANFDAFLEEFEPSYPILLVDVYAPPEPFGAPKALPTTIILDAGGFPVKTFMGPVTGKDIEAFIDAE